MGMGSGVRAVVRHADLWGLRERDKYPALEQSDVSSTEWTELGPCSPFYLFAPQDTELLGEYERGWKVTDAMPVNVLGFQTHRDHFAIAFDEAELRARIGEMRDPALSNEEISARFGLGAWDVATARRRLRRTGDWESFLTECLYRPFDRRVCYYSNAVIDRPRRELMDHVAGRKNLVLGLGRQGIAVNDPMWYLVVCATLPVDANIFRRGGVNVFPLYLYRVGQQTGKQTALLDAEGWPAGPGRRRPNLNPAFVAEMEKKLGMAFVPHPPTPSPHARRGSLPLSVDGEGPSRPSRDGGEVSTVGEAGAPWRTAPELWEKLKPLARQMRRQPTRAENELWRRLRNRQLLGCKFRRQHAIERFIIDFYCGEAQLIVEVDGPTHDYTQEEDAIRQAFLESQGLKVLRFVNQDVAANLEGVLETIAAHVQDAAKECETFGPEDVFHYIYAVLHSPTYRTRYAEFLKIDFPRVPITSDRPLFWSLVGKGAELVSLHLMESPALENLVTEFAVPGSDVVEKVRYDDGKRRVHINGEQYFEGIEREVWEFHVGGYQVLEKWLKDRKGRKLTWDDQQHYQKIVVALKETIRLMGGIDGIIPAWPIE